MTTKNDLCADVVTLDYATMLDVAKSAFAYSMDRLYETYREIQNTVATKQGNMDKAGVWVDIKANDLVDAAQRLRTAANMAHVLEAGLTRSEVKISNKPEVKGDEA